MALTSLPWFIKGLPGLMAEARTGIEHSRNSSPTPVLFVLLSLQIKSSRSHFVKGPILKTTKHSMVLSGDSKWCYFSPGCLGKPRHCDWSVPVTCACDFEWLPMALAFSAQGRDGSASKVLREKSIMNSIHGFVIPFFKLAFH